MSIHTSDFFCSSPEKEFPAGGSEATCVGRRFLIFQLEYILLYILSPTLQFVKYE